MVTDKGTVPMAATESEHIPKKGWFAPSALPTIDAWLEKHTSRLVWFNDEVYVTDTYSNKAALALYPAKNTSLVHSADGTSVLGWTPHGEPVADIRYQQRRSIRYVTRIEFVGLVLAERLPLAYSALLNRSRQINSYYVNNGQIRRSL